MVSRWVAPEHIYPSAVFYFTVYSSCVHALCNMPCLLLIICSAAGLKAAIHNPNVSDEAKENAKERLTDLK